MATGRTTELTDTGNTLTLTELSTKDTGLTTSNTVKARSTGLMVPNTRATTNLVRKTDMDSSCGQTNHPTPAISSTIISMATESIDGLMDVNTPATGCVTRCMAAASLLGPMAESMRVSTLTIRSKDMVFSRGQMEDNTTATG